MTVARLSFWRKHRWLRWALASAVPAMAVLAVTLAVVAHRFEPFLRARIVDALQSHFQARVELDSFHISLANGLVAKGAGLRIWPPVQVGGVTIPGPGQPLINLAEFRFRAPLRYRSGQPFQIPLVELKGLIVRLPPKSHFGHAAPQAPNPSPDLVRFNVDRVECTNVLLVLETSKPGKLPLDFAIARFQLTHVGPGAMGFEAELINPRPVGTIHSKGSIGPWQVSDPGETPISGDYRFDHADLASFHGIAGILNSTGHYQGTLRNLVADGEADVPDFRLTHFGNPMPLHTRFHALIDATNGDTRLEPVEATLGRSHFTAQGQIVRAGANQPSENQPVLPGASLTKFPSASTSGHDIALTVIINRARIEDFLHLASHTPTPLLTGEVTMKTTLHVPPGPLPVHERMTMKGSFQLDQARFSSPKIQDRIEQLSLRGQGRPGDLKSTDPDSVHSHMQGNFWLAANVLTLPNLLYSVPGADINLQGAYGLEGGSLKFAGTVKTQATVSQLVGGWKGLLLKPADRFFRKDGAGTEIHIHIDGTREQPEFGIDFERSKPPPGNQ